MKKWLILLVLCLCNIILATPIQDRRIELDALSQLALALGLPADKNIIEEAQKHWLRKPGKERWELEEINPDQRLIVLNWAKKQGLFSDWKPSSEVYDKALILGATTSQMQKRLDHLKQLWIQGIRFDEIVWLTGDRPLDNRVDGLTELCHNESEAARIIFEEADLPEGMRNIPAFFVAVPMKIEGFSLKRPNTEDTIIAWLKTFPKPCKALFVSDQPFCGYQFAIIKANLPKEFLFDLVGQGVDPLSHPAAASITLDAIARWIYQEGLNNP
ncbi:MAG: hypothetical protein HZB76_04360 [Chlamydiae bacterium]|nr:hypothetical protein [Chlamydiota bacterium]